MINLISQISTKKYITFVNDITIPTHLRYKQIITRVDNGYFLKGGGGEGDNF